MRRPAGPWAALLTAVLLAGGAACGAPGPDGHTGDRPAPTAAPTGTPPPLVVDVERSRSAAGRGVFEVRLRTSGDEVVAVTGLQLLDDRFTRMPAVPKSTTVRPGGTGVVMPIPAGEVVCGGGALPGPVMVVAFVTGGAAGEAQVPVSAAGDALLTRFHADECRRLDLLDEVGIAFGDDWTTVAPATARGTIRLSRTGARGPVVLDEVQGTVIFSLEVLGRSPGGRSSPCRPGRP